MTTTWAHSSTTDFRAASAPRPMTTNPAITGPTVKVDGKYASVEFGLPTHVWAGLDTEMQEKLRVEYSRFAKAWIGIFESTLVNPNLFGFAVRLTGTNVDMLQAENAKGMNEDSPEQGDG